MPGKTLRFPVGRKNFNIVWFLSFFQPEVNLIPNEDTLYVVRIIKDG